MGRLTRWARRKHTQLSLINMREEAPLVPEHLEPSKKEERPMTDPNTVGHDVTNWQEERNSVAHYRAIAEVEHNPQLNSVYQRLGETEERHSCFWEAKLRAAGQPLPPVRLNWR